MNENTRTERLRKILSSDAETEYNTIIAQEKDWAILRELSHIRTNLIQWLPIRKKDRVLEIGAGCGALTSQLCRMAAHVTATEADPSRAELIRLRGKEQENLTVLTGRVQELKGQMEADYDWILLTDSFEQAGLQVDCKTPHKELLLTLKEHLAAQGTIVLVTANRLGLKYMAGEADSSGHGYFTGIQGYEEDEKERSFSRPELLSLAEACGFSEKKMYYPYPDAVLPMSIYSDEFLPKAGELWDNDRNFDTPRYQLFHLARAFDNVIKDGLFPIFSNAFLLLLSKEPLKPQDHIIFVKYSNERSRRFSIRTDITQKTDGSRVAGKSAVFPEGEAHIDHILTCQEQLDQVYQDTPITMNRCEKTEHGIAIEYLTGETLEEQLDLLLLSGRPEEAQKRLLEYISMIEQAGSKEGFQMTQEFCETFGETMLPPGLRCSKVTDIDMVAGNVIIKGDTMIHMDYEWTFDFPVPVHYVMYRIVQNFLYGNTQRKELQNERLYKRIGLTELEIEQYTKMEAHFQKYITGKHVPLRLLYPDMTPGTIELPAIAEKMDTEMSEQKQTDGRVELMADRFERTATELFIKGWAVCDNGKPVTFKVEKSDGEQLEILETSYFYRGDVAEKYHLDKKAPYAGFLIRCTGSKTSDRIRDTYTLTGEAGNCHGELVIPAGRLRFKKSKVGNMIQKLRHKTDIIDYVAPTQMGLFGDSQNYREDDQHYDNWRLAHRCSKRELEHQSNEKMQRMPLYSLVILGDPDSKGAQLTKESVRKQSYSGYEILLSQVETFSLEQTKGDYLIFLQAGDALTANALYEFTRQNQEEQDFDMIYCDSDQIDHQKKTVYAPQFKPDFAPLTLESGNYIGNSICFSRTLLARTGSPDPQYGRQAVYDLILKATKHTDRIRHISTILYHSAVSMERSEEEKKDLLEEWELGRKALIDHFKREGITAEVSWAKVPLSYSVTWKVQGTPKISILIPTQDHVEDLEVCLSSIAKRSTYENMEILVIENNSRLESTFAYYKDMVKRYPKVKLLIWKDIFNYSAINNFAAREATGDYILFLNNDTEVLTPDWLERLIATCQHSGNGVVGCRLYYPDDTLQHAGVILGLGSIAGHLFVKEPGDISGYMGKAVLKQNLSAVTAACMLSSREAFDAISGFDENLKVALNDVDYCMRASKAGYPVIYDPEVELYHYESKSRGLDTTPEKKARYDSEVAYFTERWGEVLEKGDPYYNVNLSRTSWSCALRIPHKEVR